jgi:hypothetical protein
MKFFLFIISILFLTGCVQNLAFLGPAASVVNGGGIQQALVSESVNYGIKQNTGKNISEHVIQSLNKDTKNQMCEKKYSNASKKTISNTLNGTDCKKIK